MISQKQVDELKDEFCNPELAFNEASKIARQLRAYFEDDKIAIPLMDNNNDLYKQLETWKEIAECLSFRTLTLEQPLLDQIESKLGIKVMLQIYRFHLEERSKDNLLLCVSLPKEDLISKMKKENFTKESFMRFLDLHGKAKHPTN